jgi:hypothetical protein
MVEMRSVGRRNGRNSLKGADVEDEAVADELSDVPCDRRMQRMLLRGTSAMIVGLITLMADDAVSTLMEAIMVLRFTV